MHRTETTALTRVQTSVTRHWRIDAWFAVATVYVGDDAVATTSMVFDCAYWSAAAVEAVLQVHQSSLEAAYEL